MITISILIASLESRERQLTKLLRELNSQAEGKPVEIIPCVDNKEHSTGYKRQQLLQAAQGKYIIFIDDDDWVEPYYVDELLKAAESDADCFGMNGYMTTNGKHRIEWKLSKDYENETKYANGTYWYKRKTNHITGVKRTIALQAGFPDKSNGEDKYYSDRVAPLCKTEYQIVPVMYHYIFSTVNKQY